MEELGQEAVKKAKTEFVEGEYQKIIKEDSSKNIDTVSGLGVFKNFPRPIEPKALKLQNDVRGATEGMRDWRGQLTQEGRTTAQEIIVQSQANNDSYNQVNGDLLKSSTKAVEVGIMSLANTLKLFSSAINKTTEDLASSISLVNEQTAMYFGEGKIEGQKYAKEISALSNPSAATPDEITGAYTVVRKNFSSDSKSQELVGKMQSNTLAQSSAAQQLPAIIEAVNKTYGTTSDRDKAMGIVAERMGENVAIDSGLDQNSPELKGFI